MSQPNSVSFEIQSAEETDINNSLSVLNTKLLPLLKTLSAEDRHELPKMGDKTLAFVQKALEHCGKNPDLIPPFLDIAEFKKDVEAVETLRVLHQQLLQITEAVSDTMMLSGSEAYQAALLFYNSTKSAMKSNIQKAETIYNDLSARLIVYNIMCLRVANMIKLICYKKRNHMELLSWTILHKIY